MVEESPLLDHLGGGHDTDASAAALAAALAGPLPAALAVAAGKPGSAAAVESAVTASESALGGARFSLPSRALLW